jgi:hypothetical protein
MMEIEPDWHFGQAMDTPEETDTSRKRKNAKRTNPMESQL